MVFTSLEFFVFLPLALLGFALLPPRWRWTWLLLSSWVFYGAARPSSLIYLGAVTIVVYALGWAIERAAGRRRVALLVAGVVGLAGRLQILQFRRR